MNVAYDKLAKRRNPSVPGVVDDYHAPDQPMLDEMTEVALDVLNRHAEGFVLAAIPTTSELRAMTGKDPLQKAVGTYDAAGFPQYTVDANGYPIDPDADHKILIGFGANADRNENWLARCVLGGY